MSLKIELPSPTSPITSAPQNVAECSTTTSTKCRIDRPRRGGLGHRRLDLDRHLIVAHFQRHAAYRGSGFRTSRVLQILHDPPSLHPVVLMGDKLRPRPPSSQVVPTTCCRHLHKKHNIWGKRSHFQRLTRSSPLFSRGPFSAGDPPLISRFSEAFPQPLHNGPASGEFAEILSNSANSPSDLHTIFMSIISSTKLRDFHQLFRAFSFGKKGEKQAETTNCGKHAFELSSYY